MQHPDYSAIGKIMELLNQSKRLYALAWALVLIGLVFALGYLSGNLPWEKLLD